MLGATSDLLGRAILPRVDSGHRVMERRTFLAMVPGSLLAAPLAAPVFADERPSETRLDLFDTKSNRTGSAIIDRNGERVDFYDRKSSHTGYGTIDKGGR